jgi:hypothetical protein
MGGGYSQNMGLGLKQSPHPMPLFLECPHLGALYTTCKERKKNLINKNQGWESIHQKYKANANTSKHNPNKKQKRTIGKNLMQRRVTTKRNDQ